MASLGSEIAITSTAVLLDSDTVQARAFDAVNFDLDGDGTEDLLIGDSQQPGQGRGDSPSGGRAIRVTRPREQSVQSLERETTPASHGSSKSLAMYRVTANLNSPW